MLNTVLGPQPREALGRILPHEHVFIDISNQFSPPARAAFPPEGEATGDQAPVCLKNLSALRRNPYLVKDNLRVMDMESAVAELNYFKFYGGGAVVDQTPIGVGRDVGRLAEVSRRTGVHIIASTALYTADAIPANLLNAGAREIADLFVRDLTEGIDGTDVKAGLIGEIGTGAPVAPAEWKSLEAAALAHARTGASISVHTYPWGRTGLEIVAYLEKRGVRPERVCICHVDVTPDMDYLRALLDRGAYVEFDDYAKEFHMGDDAAGFGGGAFACDWERTRVLAQLVGAGYADQILVSNDVCLKVLLHAYGGFGYDHIYRNVEPMMARLDIPREAIHRILDENPANFLEPAR